MSSVANQSMHIAKFVVKYFVWLIPTPFLFVLRVVDV